MKERNLNNAEAQQIAEAEVKKLRALTFDELRRRITLTERKHFDVAAPSGTIYRLDVDCFWDSAPDGPIRVTVMVDDGGWRAFKPLCFDFIKAPDGSYVGE
jgi:hypothetical protein